MLIRACSFDIKKWFRFSVSCRFPITWIFNGTDREGGGACETSAFWHACSALCFFNFCLSTKKSNEIFLNFKKNFKKNRNGRWLVGAAHLQSPSSGGRKLNVSPWKQTPVFFFFEKHKNLCAFCFDYFRPGREYKTPIDRLFGDWNKWAMGRHAPPSGRDPADSFLSPRRTEWKNLTPDASLVLEREEIQCEKAANIFRWMRLDL